MVSKLNSSSELGSLRYLGGVVCIPGYIDSHSKGTARAMSHDSCYQNCELKLLVFMAIVHFLSANIYNFMVSPVRGYFWLQNQGLFLFRVSMVDHTTWLTCYSAAGCLVFCCLWRQVLPEDEASL